MRSAIVVIGILSACAPTLGPQALRDLEQAYQRLEKDVASQRARCEDLSQQLLLLRAHLDTSKDTRPALEVFKIAPEPPARPTSSATLPPLEITMDKNGSLSTGKSKRKPADALFHQALAQAREGHNDAAYEILNQVLIKYPAYEDTDSVLYWMGECRFEAGHYIEAIASYSQLLQRYAASPKAPEALLKIGLSYKRQEKNSEAKEVFQRLVNTYPQHAATELARSYLGDGR